jgi:hypothetical protein
MSDLSYGRPLIFVFFLTNLYYCPRYHFTPRLLDNSYDFCEWPSGQMERREIAGKIARGNGYAQQCFGQSHEA